MIVLCVEKTILWAVKACDHACEGLLLLRRYKYKPKQKKKLYSVSSRTNLTKAGMSTNSLASNMPDTNGIKLGSENSTDTANGREEGYTNDGFLEMTERL